MSYDCATGRYDYSHGGYDMLREVFGGETVIFKRKGKKKREE